MIEFVVATGRDRRRRPWSERRRGTARDKPPPRWKRTLSKGSARDTFVIGILLSFPAASYIAGTDALSNQNIGTAATLLAVLAFNVITLLILKLPLLGYLISPGSTAVAVDRFGNHRLKLGAEDHLQYRWADDHLQSTLRTPPESSRAACLSAAA